MKNAILLLFAFVVSNQTFSQLKYKVGDKAPKLNITNYLQNEPKDKNFDKKYILLEFWATWCTTCLAEVPNLNKLQENYKKNKDFVFISITDESPEKTKKTLERVKFNSIVVSDQTKKALTDFVVDDDQGSYAIPKTFLIDNKGIIRWIGEPYTLNEVVINKFLNGKEILESDNTVSNRPAPPR
ncbi:TlpA family protein disulfide reductase [Flavobacterium sp. 17A]|uniref:TlpA family protein disulfide reductase n=1 Tax=Flavobacterium potami TaxID=2872310 RepID=A0A9X1HAI1_9FLAO|nr:TlpA disulfide reductase family protein [Flavobacterium potami]MBZ4035733.1 TlpA family protein disulfide reductase [Flavobacterium potami]